MSISNTGYRYNAEAFLAACSFDESQERQEKFYREEIAPRLDSFENFSEAEAEAIARAADKQWQYFSTENIVHDVQLMVNETLNCK